MCVDINHGHQRESGIKIKTFIIFETRMENKSLMGDGGNEYPIKTRVGLFV